MLTFTSKRVAVTAVFIFVAVSSLTASCDTSDAPPSNVEDFIPPAWFEEERVEAEQFAERLTTCMNDNGWSGEFDTEGGNSSSQIADEDLARYDLDYDSCISNQGYDLDSIFDLSRDKKAVTYSKLVDTYSCLNNIIPGLKSPPSQEQYVDDAISILSGDDLGYPLWAPYEDEKITSLPSEEIERLRKACPLPWVLGG